MLVLQIKPENRGETFSSSFSEAVTILVRKLDKGIPGESYSSFPSGTQMWRLLTEQLTRAGVSGEHPPQGPALLSSQAGGLFCTLHPLPRTHQGRDSHGADPAEPALA